jgi:hypothetical protein
VPIGVKIASSKLCPLHLKHVVTAIGPFLNLGFTHHSAEALYSPKRDGLWHDDYNRFNCWQRAGMSVPGVRREKAALSSGCKSHPAIAPAGSSRSSYGGDEIAEAFGMRVTNR